MRSSLLLSLLVMSFPLQAATTLTTNPVRVCNPDGSACATVTGGALNITGTLSSAGAADTVGANVTFNANTICATVPTAGQTGAGFNLAAGTLAATLTPAVSSNATPSGTSCTGGNYTPTKFVDASQNTSSSLVVTNPNAQTELGIQLLNGARCAQVCTTAYTSGSAVGFLTATTAAAPPPAAGADVTDRAGRLLGVVYGSQGQQLKQTATNFNLQAELAVGGTLIDPRSIRLLTASDVVSLGAGAQVIGSLAANQSINEAQINGVTPLMGNGTSGTGAQRVVIASDNTAFSVNATLQAGAAVIGHVITDTGSTTVVTGTVSVNEAQINGVTPLMGNGVSGTGSQRVNIASDNTAFTVNASLNAGTNVIGHVITDTGSTTAVTGTVTTSGTVTANQGTANATPWNDNVAQVGGNATAVGNGATSTGTQRVTLSSDSTGQVALAAGAATIGALTANQSVNLTQIAGNAIVTSASGVAKVGIADSLSNSISAFPAQFLRVTDEPHQIFYDPFDSTLDTTNRWNAAVTGGTGTPVAASVATGLLTLSSGTGTGYSYLQSQTSLTPTIPAWLGSSFFIKIETPILATGERFWGVGTSPATPSASAPITDGYGWEIDTTGALNAVYFAGGVRTIVAVATSKLTDANYHRYIVYYRTDKIFWYFDGLDSGSLVATFTATSSPGPNVQTLPVKFQTAGNSSTTVTITCAGLAVWDTGKNNVTLSDGTFGWRKASVGSTGALSTNMSQLNGTTTDTNSGVKSAGTIRVVIATDQPALTNKLLVTPDSVALPANQSVNVSQINAVTPLMGNGTTGTGSQRVTIASDNTAFAVNATAAGDVASGVTNSGNPLQMGGRAAGTVPTAVTDGQRVAGRYDLQGRVQVGRTDRSLIVGSGVVTLSASTAETTLLASVASTFLDLVYIHCVNSSTTASRIDIRDATAGTIRDVIECPAAAGDCGGFVNNLMPLPQTTVANNWTIQASVSVTDIRCVAYAEKSK